MARRDLLVLLGAFVISLAVRWPLLDRPLSAHHEYCTAFTLIALTNWYEDGFWTHHGVPSGGFVREGERLYPEDKYDRNERALGLYYFSHPPLAYDIPFAVFRMAGVPPNVRGLQAMNLFFHLVTAVALFFAVRGTPDKGPSQGALIAAVLYCFLPAPLWFHGNAYMSDLFVQVPWVLHLVFAVRLFRSGPASTHQDLALFGITLFLTVYTSWLGVFAAVIAVLFALVQWWRDRSTSPVPVLLVSFLAMGLAIGLTAWRYLQVIDAHALLAHFAARFAVRGSFELPDGVWPHVRQLSINYRMGYLPLVLVLAAVFVQRSVLRREGPSLLRDHRVFLVLSGLPILLDHGFLLQYADHDFAALKAAPFLCGVAGILLARMPVRWSSMVVVGTGLAGVLYFYRLNPIPGWDDGRYRQEQDLGRFIAEHAAPDEVVFAIGLSTEPQVAWYARRNVIGVASLEDAQRLLAERGLERGVLFRGEAGAIAITHFGP